MNFTTAFLVLGLVSGQAFAESVSNEVLVRTADRLVKVRYDSDGDLKSRLKKISDQIKIEAVAPNLLYRPAMTRQWKKVATSAAAPALNLTLSETLLESVPSLLGFSVGPIPDVLLAPEQGSGDDPLAPQDWVLQAIRMPGRLSSQAPARGQPVITAVLDTGFDYNHEDLIGAMWRKPGNPLEVGYDFVHDNAQPFDVVHFDVDGCAKDPACSKLQDTEKFLGNPGHGTHCAGHVGAVAGNGVGIQGVGAGTQIMGLKFFHDYGEENEGAGDDAAAIKSIDYAIENHARVISASWGGRETRTIAGKSELKKALMRAQAAGLLVVIAAGNDAINQDTDARPSFPAAYRLDNLIVVAASDKDDTLGSFSNYGAKTVHIAAPGVKILSTTVGSRYQDVVGVLKAANGEAHEMDWDGTSMATPIVAGAAALLWSQHPQWTYHEVRDRILRTARPVAGLQDKVYSGGVLDVSAMLAH